MTLREATSLELLLGVSSDATLSSKNFLRSSRHLVREDDCNVLILHSSGTTGLPKAVRLSHRYMLGYAACHELPADKDESASGYNLSTLPLFHGFGLLAPCLSLSVGKPLCLPPATTIPTGQLVRRLIQNQEITSLMTVPTVLEEITQMRDYDLAASDLARLEFVASGGGGLKIATGSKLHAHGVMVLNHFGATELGALAPIFRPEKDYDWRYLRVRKDMNLRLQSLGDNDENDEQPGACKLVGRPFGSTADFELQDHLQRNPRHPDCEVKILGRKDDTVVLATGEKVLPHLMEQRLEQNDLIKSAVVVGAGQFEVGVLVEPVANVDKDPEQIIDLVWSDLMEVNKVADQHARIWSRGAIILTPPGKTIPLSDKGTPQRQEVYARFEHEIQSAYEALRQMGTVSAVHDFNFNSPAGSLRAMVQACLPEYQEAGSWEDEEDFIHLGLDSLQAKRLHQMVRQVLRACGRAHQADSLQPDFVYANSSVKKMVRALSDIDSSVVSNALPDMIETYTAKYIYKEGNQQETTQERNGNVVLLTGSTGNIGAHLLQVLAPNPAIRRIFCLIRAAGGNQSKTSFGGMIEYQKKALKDRSICLLEHEWHKISLVPWAAGDENLGISAESYHMVIRNITHVFHGAWPMDFQRKISSFEAQIKAVRDLVELCRSAHRLRPTVKPRLVLASSIAVVGHYGSGQVQDVVPELPIPSTSTLDFAYAEAKLVSERIVESAFQWLKSELQPSIVRIGQISGSQSTGYWTVKEHFPELVRACQRMGRFPNLEGSLSWLPVNRAASILSDVLLHTSTPSLVYHVENPIRQPWSNVLIVMERKLNLKSLPRMGFAAWLTEASKSGHVPTDLLHFLERHFIRMSGGGLVLDTKNTRMISTTCCSTGSLGINDIERYIEFWKSEGFLQ